MLNSKRWEYYSTPSFKSTKRVLKVHHPKIKISCSGKGFIYSGQWIFDWWKGEVGK